MLLPLIWLVCGFWFYRSAKRLNARPWAWVGLMLVVSFAARFVSTGLVLLFVRVFDVDVDAAMGMTLFGADVLIIGVVVALHARMVKLIPFRMRATTVATAAVPGPIGADPAEAAAHAEFEGTSSFKTLIVTCKGCRQIFRIGEDSIAASMEHGLQLASKAVVFGSMPREDLVAKMKDEPKGSLQKALERSRPSLEFIRASLVRGESRIWHCKECGTVNSYSQPNDAASQPGVRSDVERQATKPATPVTSKGSQTTSILEAVHKKKLQEVCDWIRHDPKCVSVRENNYLAATPLHIAAKEGQSEIVSVLLSNGADPNAKDGNGSTPLHFAANKGNKDVVSMLLKHGAANCDNKQCTTPAECAAEKGFKEVAELIAGAPKVAPKLSVHDAAREGDVVVLGKMLADNPELIFAMDENRQTPLHAATTVGVAELLLGKGANLNATDKHGNTPLHMAALGGHTELVAKLLAEGANANAKGESGWTPLRFADYRGLEDVARLLRAYGGR